MFFRKQTILCPAIAVLCLASSAINAVQAAADQPLQIKASDIADVANGAATHQTLEKKWVVSGKDIDKLTLAGVGPVFVSYTDEKIDGIAVVRVSGDSKDLINAFQVDSKDGNDATSDDSLRVTIDTKALDVKGYVLTEVMLASKAKVDVVRAQGAASVVVEDDVLSSNKDDDVTIDASGAGNVFVVGKSALSAESLRLVLSGAGNVVVATDGLTIAEHLNATLSGAGNLAITSAKLDAADTVVDVSGAGSVCVGSTSFTTKSLKVVAGGAGATTFAKGGKCTKATVSTTGVGNVDVGGVACESADVSVSGMGKTVVQASTSLSVSGSGDVAYAGDKPKTVTPESGAKAAGTAFLGSSECVAPKTPSRAAMEVEVKGDSVTVTGGGSNSGTSSSTSKSTTSTTSGSSTKDTTKDGAKDSSTKPTSDKASSSSKASGKKSSASAVTGAAVVTMAVAVVAQMLF